MADAIITELRNEHGVIVSFIEGVSQLLSTVKGKNLLIVLALLFQFYKLNHNFIAPNLF